MPRIAREKSETGIYHIMLRGINRQDLFEDDEDWKKFIETLELYKEKCGYNVYAYSLMSNHIHLLIKEGQEPLSLIIKRISSSYVYYYNLKYRRCGHLFQERFKSEIVGNDSYFLTVLRYIHQNPSKANIIRRYEDYKWSSYREYIKSGKIIDTEFVLDIFSEDKSVTIQRFISFNKEENEDNCLEFEESIKIDDKEAREIIKKIAEVHNISDIQTMEKLKRDEIIKKIKSVNVLSIRQIARVTGLSYNLVLKL